jgi:hypothetical protein
MEIITRNIILDLLPLYLANEVSADTRAFVDKFLETDPRLAKVVKQSLAIETSEDIPVPLSQDDKIKSYKKAKRIIMLHTIILAGIISSVLIITILIFFFLP